MKRLVEFPLEDGGSVLVEVVEPEAEGGIIRATRPGEIAEKALQTFESALDSIKPIANSIISKLKNLSDAPDEIEVEFGLKMSTEAGLFVAAASMEGNYRILLKWRKV